MLFTVAISVGRFWWGNLRARDHLDDLGIDGWIVLEMIFKK